MKTRKPRPEAPRLPGMGPAVFGGVRLAPMDTGRAGDWGPDLFRAEREGGPQPSLLDWIEAYHDEKGEMD